MAEKRSTKKDEPEQSGRFEKTAQDVEVVDDGKAFERVIQSIKNSAKKPKPPSPA